MNFTNKTNMKVLSVVVMLLNGLCAFKVYCQNIPVIRRQPQSQHLCETEKLLLDVGVDGTNLTYQWQKDYIDIPGATRPDFIIENAWHSHSGYYRVIITGNGSSVVSQNADVFVHRPVRIIHQPENLQRIIGSTARFIAEFEVSQPETFQWYNSRGKLIDDKRISGTTSSVLVIENIQASDTSEVFYVTASGLCGMATSNPAKIMLSNGFVAEIIQNNEPCVSEGLPFTLEATVTTNIPDMPLRYAWFHEGNQLLESSKYSGVNTTKLTIHDAIESDSGSYTFVIGNKNSGVADTAEFQAKVSLRPEFTAYATTSTLCERYRVQILYYYVKLPGNYTIERYRNDTLVNPPEPYTGRMFTYTENNIPPTYDGIYKVIVRNGCGSDTAHVVIHVEPATKIGRQPDSIQHILSGAPLTFNVVATGAYLLSYQWFKNKRPVSPLQFESEYIITNPTPADTGDYQVVVSGYCGNDTSSISKVLLNTTSIENSLKILALQVLQNHPNPFSNETSIRYYIPAASPVSIIVRDVFGRVLKTIDLGMRDAGSYSEILKADGFAEGMYFYTLQTNTAQITRRFMIMK